MEWIEIAYGGLTHLLERLHKQKRSNIRFLITETHNDQHSKHFFYVTNIILSIYDYNILLLSWLFSFICLLFFFKYSYVISIVFSTMLEWKLITIYI